MYEYEPASLLVTNFHHWQNIDEFEVQCVKNSRYG
jgi:hypothetical protein